MNNLTIVMYHYVRDLANSRYPEIKGLDRADFEEQIRYIKKHYNVISGQDLMGAISSESPLPPRSLLLTFDDGYIDHFTNVFPILEREKLKGCFFPPAKCILEHQVLDVNKIHFTLASTLDKRVLVDYVLQKVNEYQTQYDLRSGEEYWEAFGHASRFDTAEVVFVKSMLQRELPLAMRQVVTDELFSQYVTQDEASFSRELYMDLDQLKCIQQHGMYVGSHGYDHFWLSHLDTEQQKQEIDLSLKFLQTLGADTERWIMCYPYGAYNESLLPLLQKRNCIAGLTTEVDIANLHDVNALTLPRLDTNDLPKAADAPLNDWAKKAFKDTKE